MPWEESRETDPPLESSRRPGRRFVWIAAVVVLLLVGVGAGGGFYLLDKRPLPPAGGLYFVSRLELPVPLFLQGDPAWGHEPVGRSVHTMGQVGCAVTSATMVLKFYGVDTDPGRMNDYLRDHGGYTEDNDLIWEGPASLAPSQVRQAYEDLPSYYLIDSNLLHHNPVIVRLRLASGITHFVVVMGKQGFDYLIRDPSQAGLRKGVYPLRELGSKIEALRYYQKLPVAI